MGLEGLGASSPGFWLYLALFPPREASWPPSSFSPVTVPLPLAEFVDVKVRGDSRLKPLSEPCRRPALPFPISGFLPAFR